MVNSEELLLQKSKNLLLNKASPLTEKFRALFTLKNVGGARSIDIIFECLKISSSALLKHECAYCLGQMQNPYAVEGLLKILQNENEEIIVRHEAGEALAAIGDQNIVSTLKKFQDHECKEIKETCYLALKRLEWLADNSLQFKLNNPSYAYDGKIISYDTIDPTPALEISKGNIDTSQLLEKCSSMLINNNLDLYSKYQALFTLRNLASDQAVSIMAEGLDNELYHKREYLLKHEIAFVMGQLQNSVALQSLEKRLLDPIEHGMVRHECAEAIGSILGAMKELEIKTLVDKSHTIKYYEDMLRAHLNDPEPLVRESCAVALDISDYIADSDQFHMLKTTSIKT